MDLVSVQKEMIYKEAFIALVFGQNTTHALVTLSAHC